MHRSDLSQKAKPRFCLSVFNNLIARPKTTFFGKRTLVGAVGCVLALPQSGNVRMRAPLLLFPKTSLRCDFREPCCRILATHAKRVNAHDFNNFLQKAKPRFCLSVFNNLIARPKTTFFGKRTLVGAVGCVLASSPRGNARVRTPLLLFPKISLRCDFREPCCRILATHAKRVNAHDFNNFLQKAKPRFCLLHFTPRGRRTEGVNARDFYNA